MSAKTAKAQQVSILRQSQDTSRRAIEQKSGAVSEHLPPLLLCKIVSYDGVRGGVQCYTVKPLIGRAKTESTQTITDVGIADETASPLSADTIVEVFNVRGQPRRIISGAGGGGGTSTILCEPQIGAIL